MLFHGRQDTELALYPASVVIAAVILNHIGQSFLAVEPLTVLGEWLFCVGTDDFSQFCVEIPEVFRPQLGELVVTQRRKNTLDVLPVAADGGLRQLAGSDVRQPQVDIFCQRELLDGLRRVAALPLEEN